MREPTPQLFTEARGGIILHVALGWLGDCITRDPTTSRDLPAPPAIQGARSGDRPTGAGASSRAAQGMNFLPDSVGDQVEAVDRVGIGAQAEGDASGR